MIITITIAITMIIIITRPPGAGMIDARVALDSAKSSLRVWQPGKPPGFRRVQGPKGYTLGYRRIIGMILNSDYEGSTSLSLICTLKPNSHAILVEP